MADCRFCAAPLRLTFADLATSPLANSFLNEEQLRQGETFYPLHAFVCEQCFLVQLEEFETPAGIFSDYVYFSSVSTSWVEHARAYVEVAIPRFGLGPDSSWRGDASRMMACASASGSPVSHAPIIPTTTRIASFIGPSGCGPAARPS